MENSPPERSADQVRGLQWDNRILLIAPDFYEPGQWQSWKTRETIAGLKDRRLLILSAASPDDFLSFTRPSEDEKANVLLIGLDGGTKWSSPDAPRPQTIFPIIDAMPMRAAELRNR